MDLDSPPGSPLGPSAEDMVKSSSESNSQDDDRDEIDESEYIEGMTWPSDGFVARR